MRTHPSAVHHHVSTDEWLLIRRGVLIRMTPRPGRRDELVGKFLGLAQLAAHAAGCYFYLVHLAADRTSDVLVMEAWRSRAQHDTWLARAETRELMEAAEELIAHHTEPMETIPVGGKGLARRQWVRN
ncbi:MAG TPA: antibiotic biosynthesis monooxygenase [Gemmatimonadales bacterium]|nr:antibiotic biosynthesis monooxygenase [Gemmatimonadales bacterium]